MVLHVGCLRHARLCRSVAFRMRPQSSHPIPQLVARARAHNKRFSRHWRGISSTTILTLCCARSVLDRLDWAARMESKGLHASAWRLQMHLQIALQAHVLCKAHGADHSYARKAHGAHNSYARKAHGAHKCYTCPLYTSDAAHDPPCVALVCPVIIRITNILLSTSSCPPTSTPSECSIHDHLTVVLLR